MSFIYLDVKLQFFKDYMRLIISNDFVRFQKAVAVVTHCKMYNKDETIR